MVAGLQLENISEMVDFIVLKYKDNSGSKPARKIALRKWEHRLSAQ